MEKDKTSLYLLSIVGIVAVVGIVVLVLNAGYSSTVITTEDLAGQAAKSTRSDRLEPRQKLAIGGHKWGEDTSDTGGETEDSEEASCYHDCAVYCASTYVLDCDYVPSDPGCYPLCARSSGRR